MTYQKSINGSYMHNCEFHSRKKVPEGSGIFTQDKSYTGHDDLIVSLNGYVILLYEKYCELIGEPPDSDRVANINTASDELGEIEYKNFAEEQGQKYYSTRKTSNVSDEFTDSMLDKILDSKT